MQLNRPDRAKVKTAVADLKVIIVKWQHIKMGTGSELRRFGHIQTAIEHLDAALKSDSEL